MKTNFNSFILIYLVCFCSCQFKKSSSEYLLQAKERITNNSPKEALQLLDKAIQMDSNNSEAYFERGKVKDALNDKEGMCADEKIASTLGHQEAKLVYEQYCQGVTKTEFDTRMQENMELIKIHSDMPDGYYNVGNIYFDLNQFQKAIEYYNKAIEKDTKYAAAYYNRGVSLINLNMELKGCKDIEIAANLGYQKAKEALPLCGNLK